MRLSCATGVCVFVCVCVSVCVCVCVCVYVGRERERGEKVEGERGEEVAGPARPRPVSIGTVYTVVACLLSRPWRTPAVLANRNQYGGSRVEVDLAPARNRRQRVALRISGQGWRSVSIRGRIQLWHWNDPTYYFGHVQALPTRGT